MAKSNQEHLIKRELNRVKADYESARGRGLSAERLRGEKNFVEYLRLLRVFAKRYTVFIAAADTPCGAAFTGEIASELMRIGLKISLEGMFRRSYAAVIDAGELVFEGIAPSVTDAVEYGGKVADTPIWLKSVCFNVPENNTAAIVIDGKGYSPGGRGLNFVVFDMVAKNLIDAVNFDTYSDNFPCSRPSEITEGLLEYKRSHPGVTIMCFNTPGFPGADLSANEEFILKNAVGRAMILQNPNKNFSVLGGYLDSAEEIAEVLIPPGSYLDVNGVRKFEDKGGKCVNTSGGRRETAGQPKNYKRTVYIVGGCRIFGVGSRDGGTIASHLQRLFNERAPEQEAIVQNYGFYLAEQNDAQTEEELTILRSLPARTGDIVLCYFGWSDKLPCVDLRDSARRPHDYGEVFFDTLHYTEDGNRLIADRLFEAIRSGGFYRSSYTETAAAAPVSAATANGYPGIAGEAKKELEEYKNILTEFYDANFRITIGAIVMNCNPFTLGHRYLIETALERVNYLMIFVVEEDMSIFPFEDRMRLVNEGTADIDNIAVIPSGKFIISTLTFSDYFNKSEIQDRVVDPSLDVTLFAREIAPCMNISARFVGEEPLDNVTRQYNDSMKAILPRYGIELVEIPRVESEGAPISASRVRELLRERSFDEIAKLVPPSTLEYLRENF